ncbi:TPA: hypothetical protein ACX6RB_003846 [Photobacterium damselae]
MKFKVKYRDYVVGAISQDHWIDFISLLQTGLNVSFSPKDKDEILRFWNMILSYRQTGQDMPYRLKIFYARHIVEHLNAYETGKIAPSKADIHSLYLQKEEIKNQVYKPVKVGLELSSCIKIPRVKSEEIRIDKTTTLKTPSDKSILYVPGWNLKKGSNRY